LPSTHPAVVGPGVGDSEAGEGLVGEEDLAEAGEAAVRSLPKSLSFPGAHPMEIPWET
jgi:hypothetical protein